jgi:hypothetical protein
MHLLPIQGSCDSSKTRSIETPMSAPIASCPQTGCRAIIIAAVDHHHADDMAVDGKRTMEVPQHSVDLPQSREDHEATEEPSRRASILPIRDSDCRLSLGIPREIIRFLNIEACWPDPPGATVGGRVLEHHRHGQCHCWEERHQHWVRTRASDHRWTPHALAEPQEAT